MLKNIYLTMYTAVLVASNCIQPPNQLHPFHQRFSFYTLHQGRQGHRLLDDDNDEEEDDEVEDNDKDDDNKMSKIFPLFKFLSFGT